MIPDIWRVRSFRKESRDVFTLDLVPTREGAVFSFAPGQFNMVYHFGVGEVPISICGDPARQDGLVHTIRVVGAVTEALGALRAGGHVGIRGPFGSAWPTELARGRDVVIVAGGIGLPPLRPVLYHILAHREEYGRVSLLYGTRTPSDILYPRELATWRGRFDLDVNVTVDAAASDWHGNVGVVTTLIPPARFDPDDAICMVVGPEVMMRFTILQLQKMGVPDGNIFVSMERNMKCGIGLCGHCQFGPTLICRDGPVYPYERIAWLLRMREV